MADDKTTKTPEQPVTDSGPGKENASRSPQKSQRRFPFPRSRKKRRNRR